MLSIKTGGCPENCNYCAQSSSWSKDVGLKAEKLMGLEEVYQARPQSCPIVSVILHRHFLKFSLVGMNPWQLNKLTKLTVLSIYEFISGLHSSCTASPILSLYSQLPKLFSNSLRSCNHGKACVAYHAFPSTGSLKSQGCWEHSILHGSCLAWPLPSWT